MKKLLILIGMFFMVCLGCQKDESLVPDKLNDELNINLKSAFPGVLALPDGFHPEGIVIDAQNNFYVGSFMTGMIYKGNLRTGNGEVFITPPGPAQALGLAIDKRSGYLFVAGGLTGTVSVYNYRTGAIVQTFFLATPGSSLVNDIVVTRTAVYITESLNPVLYKIPLNKNGQLPEDSQVEAIPFTGDFSIGPHPGNPMPLGANANGIDATPSGKTLIIANTDQGEIYLVNPVTGEATLLDLGGVSLFYADGILLEGKTLYVAQNFMSQIAVVQLDDDLLTGSVVNYIKDLNFATPTTIDKFGSHLYAVNANFLNVPPGVFEVLKLEK